MGLLNSLQNMVSGTADSLQNSVGDALGHVADNPVVDGLQEQVQSVADVATDSVQPIAEQGQAVIGDITDKLGL